MGPAKQPQATAAEDNRVVPFPTPPRARDQHMPAPRPKTEKPQPITILDDPVIARYWAQRAETIGTIVWLMLQTPTYRDMTLSEIAQRILPPLALKQARLYKRDCLPFAYVSWAFVDEAAHARAGAPFGGEDIVRNAPPPPRRVAGGCSDACWQRVRNICTI